MSCSGRVSVTRAGPAPPIKGVVVKQLNVKPALLVATIFACGTLASLDCAGAETTHAKLARPGNPASVAHATERKKHSRAGGVASRRTATRSSIVSGKSHSRRQAAVKRDRKTRVTANRQAGHGKKHERLASRERSSRAHATMSGLASFYSDDTQTASGEAFDKRRLNAAHPSLPFGTRLRVTNIRNGRSVTVRVNDRGPFANGRIVDVTLAAAEALGMVNEGIVKVALEVVR
jgi:rare lipoprotein A